MWEVNPEQFIHCVCAVAPCLGQSTGEKIL